MARTKAYRCDGVDCTEVGELENGRRYPTGWPRIRLVLPLSGNHDGSFCSAQCASTWIEDLMTDDAVAEMEG